MLTNENGIIYQGTLVPGEFKRKVGGKGRYVFRDRDARRGVQGDTDGIYRVGLRRWFATVISTSTSACALLGISPPLPPADDDADRRRRPCRFAHAEWRKTGYGWVLRLRYFADVE